MTKLYRFNQDNPYFSAFEHHAKNRCKKTVPGLLRRMSDV